MRLKILFTAAAMAAASLLGAVNAQAANPAAGIAQAVNDSVSANDKAVAKVDYRWKRHKHYRRHYRKHHSRYDRRWGREFGHWRRHHRHQRWHGEHHGHHKRYGEHRRRRY